MGYSPWGRKESTTEQLKKILSTKLCAKCFTPVTLLNHHKNTCVTDKETDAEWWWYLLKVGQELEPTALPLFHMLGGGGMAGLFIYWQSPS